MSKIKGLIAAAYTPMDAKGELNLKVVKSYAAFLQANGVKGTFVCGTTGESTSLTVGERMKVTEAWTCLGLTDFRVIVQVGHNSLKESKRLAKHAQEAGADAISVIAPSFFKPAEVVDLIGYCADIASEAPVVPFYFYHIPAMTGVNFGMVDFLEQVKGRIPNFAGIKFTHENLMDFGLCLGYKEKRYDMLFGRDEILLGALCLGAKGAVGSTYNFMAPLFNQIIDAFKNGNTEQAGFLQRQVMEFVRVLIRHGGGVVGGKAIMKLVGVDCGPVRLPLKSVKDTTRLYHDLMQSGFFNYCAMAKNAEVPGRE
ncbi:MAG: dihydrodipicolinate synthase family protein [Cytophagales bacterium]|nr:dihydrodipicolinate synthase family protein [Cytophagales bacterium]